MKIYINQKRKGNIVAMICYIDKVFKGERLEIVDSANVIIDEYSKQGYELTLRQLYYQFVARDLIPNTQKSYKRLASIISDARLAGLIDWDAIVDRTRNVVTNSHWETIGDIIDTCARQFRVDTWEHQPIRPEVWIEKDALVGVIERPCKALDIPYFSCRGYTSQSEMWSSAMRLKEIIEGGQKVKIFHLGDHDPSGIDMSRDIEDRMRLFITRHIGHDEFYENFEFERIALNYDQVEQFRPPPNPAKLTDPRAKEYIAEHGDVSWELDALEPAYLEKLIYDFVGDITDEEILEEAEERQQDGRDKLSEIAAENKD